jgi:hypothetical protein
MQLETGVNELAKKQVSTAKLKKVQVKVPKKLYRALRKEAKKEDVAVSELALAISWAPTLPPLA